MIAIAGLFVAFGGVTALNAVSANLSDPVVGVIGPNGAGKTTLLDVMSGFIAPKAGSIHAFGADLLAMAPHRRARWGLRRSFQTEQVVDDLTVADNVRVVLDCLALSAGEREQHLAQALDFTGLAAKRHSLAQDLNGFERRLVEVAKAVAGSPKLILLDEPGAGLRAAEAERLAQMIRGIYPRFGAMTLLIDHDMSLIGATCASTLVLDFGERIAFGPTNTVLKDPRVKAAYLGVEEIA